MNVLILHQHFHTPQSGGPLRSYYLAKALIENGIHVTVIGSHAGKGIKSETVEGIKVHYLPVLYENRFGFYRRGISFLRFVFGSVRLAMTFKGVDLIYAISTPMTTGLAARIIQIRRKIPYIFEIGDLWPDAPIQMGIVKNPLLKSSLYWLERIIYKHASALVALSDEIKKRLEKKISGKPVHVVTNMSDVGFFQPGKTETSLSREHRLDKNFVISYIGAIGVANGIDLVLEWARSVSHLPIRFLICGDGALHEQLMKTTADAQLNNVIWIPFQNTEGVREVMKSSDAVIVSFKAFPILETGAPHKYFDGLAAGKLIVTNFGGWIKEEIEREKCGIMIDPRNPREFAEKIHPFLNDPALLKSYQNASRNLAEARYSRAQLSSKFVRVICGS